MGGRGSTSTSRKNANTKPTLKQKSVDRKTLSNMSGKEFVNYLKSLKNVKLPPLAELPNADTQKMVFQLGLNDKPTLVSENEFDKINGTEYYRGITQLTDNFGTILATAQGVANDTMRGEYSRIGAGVNGDGFYFTKEKQEAIGYANRQSQYGKGINKSAVIKMKLDKSKVKAITADDLRDKLSRESAEVIQAVSNASQVGEWNSGNLTTYALYKGYNVIEARGKHAIVLDRSVMVMPDKIYGRV